MSQSIRLRWGKGFEDPIARHEARPALEHSCEQASDSLKTLGLESDEAKHGVINQGRGNQMYGGSNGTKTFHLYVRPYLTQLTIPSTIDLTASMTHEWAHCERMKYFPLTSAQEHAATEGIAFTIDRLTSLALHHELSWPKKYKGVFDKVQELPPVTKHHMRSSFLRSVHSGYANCQGGFDYWVNDSMKGLGISRAAVIGILAVKSRMRAGYQISDLLTMPTEFILGM